MIETYRIILSILCLIASLHNTTIAQEVIYYCSNSSGSYQVYKKDLGTNIIDTITNDSNNNYWWVEPSPKHDQLLMMRSPVGMDVQDQFDYEISQMLKSDIDGTNKSIIVDFNQYGWNAFGNPHWHPNGNRIIMLAQPTAEFFIYTIDTEGTNPQQLTNLFSLDPNWSPDGTKITFIGLNDSPTPPASFDDFEVYIADYDSLTNSVSNINQLTDDTLRDQDPCFSPDGSMIAFSSGSESLSYANLVTIDADGSNRIDLVDDNTTNGGPVNWGTNNKIYYHNVNLFVTPFTAKEYSFNSTINSDLFPSMAAGYISPYYIDVPVAVSTQKLPVAFGLSIYPNPVIAGNILTLEIEEDLKGGVFSIIDLSGRVEFRNFIYNKLTNIDVSSLNPGLYVIEVSIGLGRSCGVIEVR